jgi:hypothetical protein
MPEATYRAWRRKEADQNFGWWNNRLANNTNQSFLDLLSLFFFLLPPRGAPLPPTLSAPPNPSLVPTGTAWDCRLAYCHEPDLAGVRPVLDSDLELNSTGGGLIYPDMGTPDPNGWNQ